MLKRNATGLAILVLLSVGLSACATYIPAGVLYTDAKGAVSAAGGEISYTKIGIAEAKSVFSLVAWGDASIQTAAKNGGITKIKYVDYEVNNVLGIFGKYQTIVYGD
jgi:hypothetical protein